MRAVFSAICVKAGAVAGVLALAACSPGSAERAPAAMAADAPAAKARRHPESGLAVVPLSVTAPGKPPRTFRVEVAASPAEQARGLMFRTAMGADEGMIFPVDPPRMASFWMKNTVIPLDIIYIGTDGRILNIHANTVPYSQAPLLSDGQVKGVLELNGGRAAQLGIAAGDMVTW